jgi:hypothetical protein
VFIAFALIVGGLVYAKQRFVGKTAVAPSQHYVPAPAPSSATTAVVSLPASNPQPTVEPLIAKAGQRATSTPVPATPASLPKATIVVKAQPEPLAAMTFGGLAVSSPVATEIYEGGQLLGSAPTTLQLSGGSHTLEYRHGDLRKTVTYSVKADETATALVTFDVVVQINAKPWAQVFLDGSERQALGQTPLSDVKVPIGRVLIFENPKFPAKSYKVTGKETAIQIAFP